MRAQTLPSLARNPAVVPLKPAGLRVRSLNIIRASAKVDDINKTVGDNKVVVYSKTYCPYCARAKDLFNRLNVPAKVIELDEIADGAAWQDALREVTGRTSVPQVFVGGQHVGGCDDTMAAYQSNKLQKMLADAGISI
eukprot:jgi/Chrzof1/10764/Cz05g11110.t1